jgi:hypothetical protein
MRTLSFFEFRTLVSAGVVSVALVSGAVAQVTRPNPPVLEGGATTALLFDNFDYAVARTEGDVMPAFRPRGWYDGRQGSSRSGYLYTRADATRGSNVLVMESIPSLNPPPAGWNYGQTDYWLQYGSGAVQGAIPPNVWFQFWTYATPESRFAARDKTLYACRSNYPCTGGNWMWLFMWGRQGFEYANNIDQLGPAQNRFLALETETADHRGAPEYPTGARWLYQNLSRTNLVAGRWYQVRMHMDISGPQGVWEAWIRERGQSAWTKVADWRGGVTPNFSWPIPVEQRVGHRVLRIPTTVNGPYGDSTTYMDDFVIASAFEQLPAD